MEYLLWEAAGHLVTIEMGNSFYVPRLCTPTHDINSLFLPSESHFSGLMLVESFNIKNCTDAVDLVGARGFRSGRHEPVDAT